jgi:hypothetical protein
MHPKENTSSYLDVVAKQHPQNEPQRKRPRYIGTATRKQTQPARFAFIYIDLVEWNV